MRKNKIFVALMWLSISMLTYFCEERIEAIVLPNPIEAPKNISVETQGNNSLKVCWNIISDASYYSILRSRKYDEDYMLIDTVRTNYYLDQGLTEGILYFYKIVAKNDSESKESIPSWGVPCDASKDSIYAIFDGYTVTGKVFYHDSLEDKRIVWWVKTDIWYIQPLEDAYYTQIDSNGCFWRKGHYGNKAHIILTTPNRNLPTMVWPGSKSWGVTPLLELYLDEESVIQPRFINFSGYKWQVKSSENPVGPGPNYFSDSKENVWIDDQGQLHLKITYRNVKWNCAEVFTEQSFGYKEYVFYVASRVDQLDKNVVGALFTYLDDNNEIDIEFAKWGQDTTDNAQYVVQPYYHAGNIKRFNMQLDNEYTSHRIVWRSDSINFCSLVGHYTDPPTPNHVIHEWDYTGDDIPQTSDEKVHINLWLFRGHPPSDGKEIEMVIKKFELR